MPKKVTVKQVVKQVAFLDVLPNEECILHPAMSVYWDEDWLKLSKRIGASHWDKEKFYDHFKTLKIAKPTN